MEEEQPGVLEQSKCETLANALAPRQKFIKRMEYLEILALAVKIRRLRFSYQRPENAVRQEGSKYKGTPNPRELEGESWFDHGGKSTKLSVQLEGHPHPVLHKSWCPSICLRGVNGGPQHAHVTTPSDASSFFNSSTTSLASGRAAGASATHLETARTTP